jgi:hypothetical protein
MSAHTPGPWYVEEKNSFSTNAFYIRGSDSNGNPLTWGKGCVAHIPKSTVTQMGANARLIAAAPEMLEALDKIACFAPGNGDVCEIIAKVARAAIVKAEGQQ